MLDRLLKEQREIEMKVSILLFALISTLMLTDALAWGPTGHRVVGDIAEKYISKKTKQKIDKILDGHSMARASNWPDEVRSDPTNYSHTFPWHYTDWPDHHQDYDPSASSGTLITAIDNNKKILLSATAKPEDKKMALQFLIHLIGDLHMPLHVGNGLDRGGNSCKVVFHKNLTNLHKLWDEDMIDFTRLSYSELSIFVDVVSKDEIKKIQSGTVLDWARESKNLRNMIYPAELTPTVAQQVLATDPNLKNYCNRELNLPQEALPQLGYEYSYQFIPVVHKRLLEGGLRLAMVLEELFK